MRKIKEIKSMKLFSIVLTMVMLTIVVNAANPGFVNIWNNYVFNSSEDVEFIFYVKANDSDLQYPLDFTDTSEDNMTIFNMDNFNNTHALINFTPTNDNVAVYSFFIIVKIH